MAGRLAVLIDGENICGDVADELFKQVAGIGQAVVRRAYGNFANSQAKTWLKPMVKHGIIAQQVCGGKNAADFALTIEAVNLLRNGGLGGFCIVSCDKDFSLLAANLRERGVEVFGFGKSNTPQSYRANCTRFIAIDDFAAKKAVEQHPATALILAAMEGFVDSKGRADLAVVGQEMQKRHKDYKKTYGCGSLSKLVEQTKAFGLEEKKTRIRRLSGSS